MPVINALRKLYQSTKPLQGIEVATDCLHVTKETGVLTKTLKAAAAKICWYSCSKPQSALN